MTGHIGPKSQLCKSRKRTGENHFACLVLVLFLLGFALGAFKVAQKAEAVRKIKSSHGTVRYDWQFSASGKYLLKAQPPMLQGWQQCVGFVLGAESVYLVKEIEFHKGCTDEDLRLTKNISSVERINLAYCYDISDAGILHVSRLPNLRKLYLYRNDPTEPDNFVAPDFDLTKQGRITDRSLEYLARSTSIEELYLWDNDFSDQGLEYLERNTSLLKLRIRSPRISAKAIDRFKTARPQCHVDQD